ncbi:MAG: radical SAM protein [Planctomycetaceae bacterium]|jgi:DNA repair photolyase|nr:radical SAM protein [Planctomycetaceae bacterium]
MLIREIETKHILTHSKLPGLGYSINPYVGCQHACVYCYARFMKRFTNHDEPWGQFVDAKINGLEVFGKDIAKVKPGTGAFIASVTDAYQPVEGQYKLTRSILEQIADSPPDLLKNKFAVSILTKSDLVLRDLDILKRLEHISVGFSIAMTNETACRRFEPRSAPIRQRIAALKILRDAGIRTYVFISPILPGITDLPAIFEALEGMVEYVNGETLNMRCGNLADVLNAVSLFNKELKPVFGRNIRSRNYWKMVEKQFYELAQKHDIPVKNFFHHIDNEPDNV